MSSGDNNFNDTRRKLLTVFGVIDIVMAYYCKKMCPKLPPHNSSYTFHNSSWRSQNGVFLGPDCGCKIYVVWDVNIMGMGWR